MKTLPTKYGELDPDRLSIEENHARLKPLLQALTANLQANALHAAANIASEMRKTSWAIAEKLHERLEKNELAERALTLTRKETA